MQFIALGGTSPSAAQDVVNGNGTSAKKDQGEGQGSRREGELISGTIGSSDESVVQVPFPDGNKQIDENGERRNSGEESCEDQQPTEKFGEGGDIAQPCGQAETGHHLRMVV